MHRLDLVVDIRPIAGQRLCHAHNLPCEDVAADRKQDAGDQADDGDSHLARNATFLEPYDGGYEQERENERKRQRNEDDLGEDQDRDNARKHQDRHAGRRFGNPHAGHSASIG